MPQVVEIKQLTLNVLHRKLYDFFFTSPFRFNFFPFKFNFYLNDNNIYYTYTQYNAKFDWFCIIIYICYSRAYLFIIKQVPVSNYMPGWPGQIQSKMYVNSRVFRISSQYIFVMEKVWYSHSLLNYTHIKM